MCVSCRWAGHKKCLAKSINDSETLKADDLKICLLCARQHKITNKVITKYAAKSVHINFTNKTQQKMFVFNKSNTSKLEIINYVIKEEKGNEEAEKKKKGKASKK